MLVREISLLMLIRCDHVENLERQTGSERDGWRKGQVSLLQSAFKSFLGNNNDDNKTKYVTHNAGITTHASFSNANIQVIKFVASISQHEGNQMTIR